MTILDQKAFISTISPFEKLQTPELDSVVNAMNIAYFKVGETIIPRHTAPTALYIVIKGIVQEISDQEINSVFFPQDMFDVSSLLKGESQHDFIVQEELICYVLPKAAFLNLLQKNVHFATFYQQNLASRLANSIQQRDYQEITSFMASKIKEVPINSPVVVDAETSVYQAVQIMAGRKTDCVLVQNKQMIGIVTDKDLRNHVVLQRYPIDQAIGQIATYNLIGIATEDFILNALVIMVKHALKHLIVYDRDNIVGVVKQLDLLSYLSNHTHLIAVQIEQAQDLTQLKIASQNMLTMIQALQANGMKINYVMQWVKELNQQLFKKLYHFIAPPELIENSCLIVLGSEGRGEQILKTDQDNALILRDDFVYTDLQKVMQTFTETLLDFGYPTCLGGVMVSNPDWCQSLASFKAQIFNWVLEFKTPLLNLAIFLDARSVAGDKTLLIEVKHHLQHCLQNNQAFFAHFAKTTLAFETPLRLFTLFVVEKDHDNQLDIKKGGIFPIVHGVRSLALEYNILATNTVERIKALTEKNILDLLLAEELQEAFYVMTTLRLRFGLENIKLHKNCDNYITPSRLNKLERDLLKDAFSIVNHFKKFITYHYRLDQFT